VVLTASNQDRSSLRKALRQARRELTARQQQQASQDLLTKVLQADILPKSGCCAFYISNDGELSPDKIIQHCWNQGLNTSLPVLHPFSKGHLLFLRYQHNSAMQHNKYGIAEPKCEVTNVVPLQQHKVIFTPLVGFDSKGNRLGMGGGYYDRTLASLKNVSSIRLIGLAHDCQQVEQLPCQSWDIPLNMIITPSRIIKC